MRFRVRGLSLFVGLLMIWLLFFRQGTIVENASKELVCDSIDDIEHNEERSGLFSMHRCHGGGSSSLEPLEFATGQENHRLNSCEFSNLCYDRTRGTFVYYTAREEFKRVPFKVDRGSCSGGNGTVFGRSIDVMPKELVGVRARSLVYDALFHESHTSTAMKIRQIVGDIPSSAKWAKGRNFLMTKRWAAANWGHLLVQNVLAAFSLMQNFAHGREWLINDINFVFLDDCFDEKDSIVAFPPEEKFRRACHKHSNSVYGLLSGVTPRNIEEIEPEENLVCFPRVLAGTEVMGFLHGPLTNDGGRGWFMGLFRDFVLEKNSLQNVGSEAEKKKESFLVVVAGKGKISFNTRGVANVAEIVEFLRTRYEQDSVEVVHMEVEKISVKEQAKLLSSADVFISPGGATGMGSIFLKASASMILIPFCDFGSCFFPSDPSKCACNKGYCCYLVEDFFYHYLTANVIVLPVSIPSEIVGACDCNRGLCKDCNVKVNLETLEAMIERAFHYTRQRRKVVR